MALEGNDKLRGFTQEHSGAITMVYDKLTFFNQSKAHGFWFTFWHDVFVQNSELTIVKKNESFLSPFSGESIAYQFYPKEKKQELIDLLKEKGLTLPVKCGGARGGYLNDEIIDKLYARLDEFGESGENVEIKMEEDGPQETEEKERECKTRLLCDDKRMNFAEEYGIAVRIMRLLGGEKYARISDVSEVEYEPLVHVENPSMEEEVREDESSGGSIQEVYDDEKQPVEEYDEGAEPAEVEGEGEEVDPNQM